MPRSFTFVDPDVRIWIPLAFSNEERSEDRRYSQNHEEIARLAPGATIGQAKPRVDALNAANLEKAGPLKAMLMATGYHSRIVPFADDLVADVRRPLQLLWGGVLFVLLIAAVNITNLVLVRASGRSKELATRHALGAARGRVAQQLLTETTLLTAVGALLGVAFGAVLLRYLSVSGLADLPRGTEIRMDGVVVAFTVGVATLLGLATAAVPIVHLAGIDILHALREEGRSGTSGRGARLFRRSMVVVQVALAFVLLIGAGLLLDSFRQLMAVDPGFKAVNVLTGKINPPAVRYPDDNANRTLGARALEGIRQLPGVKAAGITTLLPFAGNNSSSVIVAEGYVPAPGESVISPNQIEVTPGYFEAMGIPLKRGRLFTDADGPGAPGVIIVDERLAKKFWPNTDPIGRRMLKPEPARGPRESGPGREMAARGRRRADREAAGPGRDRRGARGRLLHAVRAGAVELHHVRGEDGRRTDAGGRRDPARDCRHRSRDAALRRAHDAGTPGTLAEPAADADAAVAGVRRHRPAPGRHRHLRRARLPGRAPLARDRHSHGPGRRSRRPSSASSSGRVSRSSPAASWLAASASSP